MDGLYDVVESVHIFIPVVAVIFLVVMLFVCGVGKFGMGGGEPPEEYINKFQRFDEKGASGVTIGLPKKNKKKKQAEKATKQQEKVVKSPAEKSGVRQRKPAAEPVKEAQTAPTLEPAAGDAEEWVTVTPKKVKAAVTPKIAESVTDKSFDEAMKTIKESIAAHESPVKTVEKPNKKAKVEKKKSATPPPPVVDETTSESEMTSEAPVTVIERMPEPVEPVAVLPEAQVEDEEDDVVLEVEETQPEPQTSKVEEEIPAVVEEAPATPTLSKRQKQKAKQQEKKLEKERSPPPSPKVEQDEAVVPTVMSSAPVDDWQTAPPKQSARRKVRKAD